MTLAAKKRLFNKILFAWHKKGYRDMPWRPQFPRPKGDGNGSTPVVRDTCDPYHILISEIMLQQTQVDRVRLKYVEFLKKFPDVFALARAPLGDVLRLWSGLGYNRRAKYLHECAKKVVREYGGVFPQTFEELTELPGIGRSTAGALLAFSYGQDTPMIDTNIRRILVRVFFGNTIPSDKVLYDFAVELIPKGKGRMWNYAMLDLGAMCCTARNHSAECPLTVLHGSVDDFVYKKPQKKFKDSRRYFRGQILKLLAMQKTLHIDALPKLLGKNPDEVADILDDLKKEQLIVLRAGRIAFPR